MLPRLPLIAAVIGLSPMLVWAVPSTIPDQEYEQVRRIALRDPKVKAAFENANQRLEAKIVEIDPALKGHVKGRASVPPGAGVMAESQVPRQSFLKPSKPKASIANGGFHLIVTGDTFSSIAKRYKVTVAELKEANPNVNETKLQVGEKLSVPSHHQHAFKAAAVEPGSWERLKSKF